MISVDEAYANRYLKVYKKNARKLFPILVETNPQAFPLLATENIHIYSVSFSKDYFIGTDYRDLIFVHKTGENLGISFIDCIYEEHYRQLDLSDSPIRNKKKLLSNIVGIKESDILAITGIDKEFYGKIQQDFSYLDTLEEKYLQRETFDSLQSSAINFKEHINQPMGYYSKNAAKYAYSLLDLNPILKKVNDEDFSYQLDQAIAAYDNSLYLASCATLGVCLETLCKLLLLKEGVRVKDSDATMLDKLSELLKENKIINYKFKQRIDVCYKVRNLSSHTSPGKVLQNDCHFILNTIHEIVDIYF